MRVNEQRIFFLVVLGSLAVTIGPAAVAAQQPSDKPDPLLTVGVQVLVLLGALLGAGGGLKYFLEPMLKRRHLRKVVATGLWLSCYELRHHLDAIRQRLSRSDVKGDRMRDSLLKIPRYDFGGRPDWFVKSGYTTMITAYKIAAFSSWMRIYQRLVLQGLLVASRSDFISELFQKFDTYKVAASGNTVLWYSYIDAIGEKIIANEGELLSPLDFSEFCKKYNDDREFLYYFDQLHMFIHFMGRKDEPWSWAYQRALTNMIDALQGIEDFIAVERENLLKNFKPQDRTRAASADFTENNL
jgi:hypothetical protein